MEKETVLITGITGKTGKYLLERMIKENSENEYITIVRPTSDTGLLDSCGLKIKKMTGDLNDAGFLNEAIKNADTVLHISGISYSLRIVEAAVKNNVKRIILVHTTGIYSKYKKAGEDYRRIEDTVFEMIKGTDISLTIVRPTMIYGSLDDENICSFIKMVDKFRVFPVIKKGKFALQPVHQKDLGNAYYDILINPDVTGNKNYVLSGPYPIDLIDILKIMSECLDKKTVFISIPFWSAYFAAWVLYLVSLKRFDYREKVQRLVEPRAYGHEEAARDFGYAPADCRKGIAQEVSDYMKARAGKL